MQDPAREDGIENLDHDVLRLSDFLVTFFLQPQKEGDFHG
jgi:hypothetical protein